MDFKILSSNRGNKSIVCEGFFFYRFLSALKQIFGRSLRLKLDEQQMGLNRFIPILTHSFIFVIYAYLDVIMQIQTVNYIKIRHISETSVQSRTERETRKLNAPVSTQFQFTTLTFGLVLRNV